MPHRKRPLLPSAPPRCVPLLAVLFSLAVAAPADAQVRVRDHRTKKQRREVLRVERWSPQRGPVGTEVTLYGEGFGRTTTILFDGRRVRPTEIRAEQMSFRVPRRYGDGEIVVRKPRARQVRVGTFYVESPPVVRRFAPRSGIPGTRVEIWGAAFEPGDDVLMNGRSIRVLRRGERRLLVEIPPWARTDYLVVRRADGSQGRTRARFRVAEPAPRLTGLAPRSGPPGAIVRLHGEHLSPRDRAFYGSTQVAIQRRGAGWIEVAVPERARRSDYFRVQGPGGQSRSREIYRLVSPPIVTGFSPRSGRPGDRVDLYGENFEAGDQVRLGDRWLKIIQLRADRITVGIPPGARSGAFTVVRGDARVTTRDRFELGYAPELLSFRPEAGEAGEEVTLHGRYLGGTEVYYGRKRLRVLSRTGDHTVVVRVPRRARDRRFRVRTPYGEAAATRPFQVRRYPTLVAVSPRRGAPGTRIRVRGRDLERVDAFYLGATELPIVSRQRRWIEVEVPRGAGDGRLAWSSYGRRVESRWRFQVLEPRPELRGFEPRAGQVGDEVTLRGRDFSPTTEVLFGKTAAPILRRSEGGTELVVKVPPVREGRQLIWVRDRAHADRARRPFFVRGYAAIDRFSPRRTEAGETVEIYGRNLSPSARIYFGDVELAVARADRRGRRLWVEVPDDLHGKDWLYVDDGGHRSRSEEKLHVKKRPKKIKVRDHRKGKGRGRGRGKRRY